MVVGGIATSVHYLLLLALAELAGVDPAPAAGIGAAAGAVVAYAGNRAFTFAGTTVPHRVAVLRFLALAAVGALLNAAIVGTGTRFVGLHYLASQLVATGVTLLVTYRAHRRWTFG